MTAVERVAYLKEWRKNNKAKCDGYRDAWRAANPEKHAATQRRNFLWRMYQITPERYDQMLKEQSGLCAICETDAPGGPRRYFCVDHDHACCPGAKSCGRCVRGLLCNDCNQALGRLRDDARLLHRAAHYLEKFRT